MLNKIVSNLSLVLTNGGASMDRTATCAVHAFHCHAVSPNTDKACTIMTQKNLPESASVVIIRR